MAIDNSPPGTPIVSTIVRGHYGRSINKARRTGMNHSQYAARAPSVRRTSGRSSKTSPMSRLISSVVL
jgi:hypothetical protein